LFTQKDDDAQKEAKKINRLIVNKERGWIRETGAGDASAVILYPTFT